MYSLINQHAVHLSCADISLISLKVYYCQYTCNILLKYEKHLLLILFYPHLTFCTCYNPTNTFQNILNIGGRLIQI